MTGKRCRWRSRVLTRDERKGGMQDRNRENTTTSKLFRAAQDELKKMREAAADVTGDR